MKSSISGEEKILVVEDEPGITQVCQRTLIAEGYQVDTAANGAIAQNMLLQEDYDLVIIDLRMPGLNGVETLRKLWEMGQTARIYITTGFYNEFRDQLQCAADEAISFFLIKKPVDIDEIRSIARVVSERPIRFRKSTSQVKSRVFNELL